MLDEPARRLKNSLLSPIAHNITFISPTQLSIVGLGLACVMFVLLWQQNYLLGLIFWWLNRLFDGLDGLVARQQDRQSDLGAYVDIICDFIAYALLPIGLVLGMLNTPNLLALVALITSFYINGASWMYLAALLEKRNLGAAQRGESTSITMPDGLVGGFETIVFFSLFILAPQYIFYLFLTMAVLVGVGILLRIRWAYQHLT